MNPTGPAGVDTAMPRSPSRSRFRLISFLFSALSLAALVALVGLGTLAVAKRMHTGHWVVPTTRDAAWFRSTLTPSPEPPRVIYLRRQPVTLEGALADASHRNLSSVLGENRVDRVTTPGFSGSDRAWNAIADCVRSQFRPFDVRVVETRPRRPGYTLVAVGGRARDLGIERTQGSHHVEGLAPFSGGVIPNPVVFGFADAVENRPRAVCETIAMEVGHAYGLDHAHHCKDVMTYLDGCGPKRFVDASVPCGEHAARACTGGGETQNSHAELKAILGARPPPRVASRDREPTSSPAPSTRSAPAAAPKKRNAPGRLCGPHRYR